MIVSLKRAEKIIKDIFRLQREMPEKLAILISGPTGIGKTTMVKRIAQEFNIPLLDIRLARKSPEQIGGIPFPLTEEKGDVKWFKKALPLELKLAFETPTILFLDEYNRSTMHIRNAVMSLVFERRLEGIELHPDSIVMIAINYGEEYQVEEIDPAFIARCHLLNVVYDYSDLKGFAEQLVRYNAEKVIPILGGIWESLHNKLKTQNPEEVISPVLCRRSITNALLLIHANSKLENPLSDQELEDVLRTVVPADIIALLKVKIDYELIEKIKTGEVKEIEIDRFIEILPALQCSPCKNKTEFFNILEFMLYHLQKSGVEGAIIPAIAFLRMLNEQFFNELMHSENPKERTFIQRIISLLKREKLKTF